MGTKNLNSATDLITFTRASGGTALRKISYGSELVTNGTFDTDSDWTKPSGWVISGGEAVATNVASLTLLQSTGGVTIPRAGSYLITADVSVSSGTGLAVSWNTSGLTPSSFEGVSYETSGVVTRNVSFSTGGTFLVGIRTNGTVTGTVDNVSVKEVLYDQPDGTLQLFNSPANTPRIEYNADGTVKGLLIEEARTNLVPYSNDLTDASWLDHYVTRTSPTSFTAIAVNQAHMLVKRFEATSGVDYTFQTKLSYENNQFVSLRIFVGISPHVCFDLINGTIAGTQSGASGTITDIGNGEFLCSITVTASATQTGNAGIWLQPSATNFGSGWLALGTEKVTAKNNQLEAGAFPTSYIPTTGSTATRAADFAQIPTSAFGFKNDKGSLVIDVLTPVAEQYMALGFFNTANYNNSRSLWKSNPLINGVGDDFVFQTYDGTVTKFAIGQQNQAEHTKLGLSYGGNEKAVKDGGTVFSGISRYPNPTRLFLGGRDDGYQSQCWIKSIKYYPRRLSDTQLQELTT